MRLAKNGFARMSGCLLTPTPSQIPMDMIGTLLLKELCTSTEPIQQLLLRTSNFVLDSFHHDVVGLRRKA